MGNQQIKLLEINSRPKDLIDFEKMEIHIRTASPEDAGQIRDLYAYYVLHTAITYEYEVPSPEEMRERIEHTLRKYPYIVAEEKGKILGYAYAGSFKQRAAYDWSVETSIYVSKDARGRGIGKGLLDLMEGILKAQNILNVNACIAVPEEKEDQYLTFDSVRFHEKMGYEPVGTFHKCACKFDRWYNMIWMEKMLGGHSTPPAPFIPFPQLETE